MARCNRDAFSFSRFQHARHDRRGFRQNLKQGTKDKEQAKCGWPVVMVVGVAHGMAGNIIVIKMSADNAESEKDMMMMMFCCAGCGTPEVDDIKLKQVPLVILSDIAATHVKKIIGCNTKRSARRERLNYVTKYYSSSLKAVMRATARSVCYRYRLIQVKLF
eukprot:scaffold5247_cov158-Skeletonema_marinoi.AAC.6